MQAASSALKNDEWITDEEVADPSPLPKIPGYHILVRPVSVKSATKGGIILPDSTKSGVTKPASFKFSSALADSSVVLCFRD